MAIATLPSFFVLQAYTGGPYLCTLDDHVVNFTSTRTRNFTSPRVKFAAEQSKTGDVTLVHIRSCFNNKYLVAHQVCHSKSFTIAASANKPEEDTTDPACTLFRVSSDYTSDGTLGFRLFSISRSRYAVHEHGGFILQDHNDGCKSGNTFPVVNWEDLVILPSQVSFKSELLNKYLSCRFFEGLNYHRFESGFDISNPQWAYELVPAANGNYRIKSSYFGKYWRAYHQWVVADAEDNNNSDDTLFSFTKISDNVFVLSNLGTKKFSGANQRHDFIRTDYPEITKDTRIILEERVLKRKISHVKYRLRDSIVHDEVVQVNEFVTNDTRDNDITATLDVVSLNESIFSTWNNSESLSFGTLVSVDLEVSEVPFVAKPSMQVKLETDANTLHQWGQSKSREVKTKVNHAVPVPALTTMKLSLMVSKSVCDVPFDYMESVLLPDGNWATKAKDDGIYKGISNLSFEIQTSKVHYNPSLGKLLVPGKDNPIPVTLRKLS
ncbi:uncharacterized protein LOC143535055 [Bidens hawaiensis]|uniref:uncharacterized protein LOC143535055 n=1 Tax=Bidens hawaiensis TaxID=980011 RepID=UPI00404A882F